MSTTVNLAKLDPSRYRPTCDPETYQLVCALAQEVELQRAKLIAECYGKSNLGRHLEPSEDAEKFLQMPWYEIAAQLEVLTAVEYETGIRLQDIAKVIESLDPPNRGEFFWMAAFFRLMFFRKDPEALQEDPSARRWRRADRFHQLGGAFRKAGDSWQFAGIRGALTALTAEERANRRTKATRQDVSRDLKEIAAAYTTKTQGSTISPAPP